MNMPLATRQAVLTNFQGVNPRLLQNNYSITPDKLSFIQTFVFTDLAAKDAYLADALIVADDATRLAHCSANGIAFSESVA
jgi:hypothetical protein